MATFYPNFKTILASPIAPTNTELKLLTFLRDTLNAKYEVYYRPNINGDMPQIIILKKGAGVLLLETCDYNLENYELNSRSKWKIKSIESIVKSPFDKVLEYKQNIFNLHIPNLLEQRLKKPLLWDIVHCAVYFSEEIEEAEFNLQMQQNSD